MVPVLGKDPENVPKAQDRNKTRPLGVHAHIGRERASGGHDASDSDHVSFVLPVTPQN